MNAIEQVLNDEVNRLVDRLAASLPDGCLAGVSARHPTLRRQLDEAESRLAAVRASLVNGYGRWRRALEDVENLWALAAWRSAGEAVPAGEEDPGRGPVEEVAAQTSGGAAEHGGAAELPELSPEAPPRSPGPSAAEEAAEHARSRAAA